MEIKSYEELAAKAVSEGVNNNKVAIGMWIRKQGYKSKRKVIRVYSK